MNALQILFSHICGQQNLWTLGGITLPFCQRCTGLYVGIFFAIMIIAILRPQPSAFLYWLHGAFMLLMFPFGFHLIPHGGLIRTLTGILFAFGMAYYLVLNPMTVWSGWISKRAPGLISYLLSVALTLGGILVAISHGSAASALLLTLFGTAGLLCMVLLILANLIVLPRIVRSLLHPRESISQ